MFIQKIYTRIRELEETLKIIDANIEEITKEIKSLNKYIKIVKEQYSIDKLEERIFELENKRERHIRDYQRLFDEYKSLPEILDYCIIRQKIEQDGI